ncbi:MAG: hypothetical protein KAR39_05370 [Thermoplasmata archaeon]|nr:hypothetical protein [Thermoplasmata archaeon]
MTKKNKMKTGYVLLQVTPGFNETIEKAIETNETAVTINLLASTEDGCVEEDFAFIADYKIYAKPNVHPKIRI